MRTKKAVSGWATGLDNVTLTLAFRLFRIKRLLNEKLKCKKSDKHVRGKNLPKLAILSNGRVVIFDDVLL